MRRMLVFFQGIEGYKKLWVTLEEPAPDGTFKGQIHKQTEVTLLGFGQLAIEGRMKTIKGTQDYRIIEVSRDGSFAATPY